MEFPLFEEVADLVRTMVPSELGQVRTRSHRRGVKLWFDTDKPGREHYEAQLLSRRHVDGADGTAVEIGFHSEHSDEARNTEVVAALARAESSWRNELGISAELAPFLGAANWRRLSECWIEPDVDDPELAFELAARLVDYVTVLEPLRTDQV
ncbi:MAG: hypothetical protein OES24_14210 [Acidimicrobiia bacterium]|nr:hypothetical protein [Acidimicrobiia bacterium]